MMSNIWRRLLKKYILFIILNLVVKSNFLDGEI